MTESIHFAHFNGRTDKIAVYFCRCNFGDGNSHCAVAVRLSRSVFPLLIEALFAHKDYKRVLFAK